MGVAVAVILVATVAVESVRLLLIDFFAKSDKAQQSPTKPSKAQRSPAKPSKSQPRPAMPSKGQQCPAMSSKSQQSPAKVTEQRSQTQNQLQNFHSQMEKHFLIFNFFIQTITLQETFLEPYEWLVAPVTILNGCTSSLA